MHRFGQMRVTVLALIFSALSVIFLDAVGVAIGDVEVALRSKNGAANRADTAPRMLFRWDERSRQEPCGVASAERRGVGHRLSWLPVRRSRTVVAPDDIGVLAGNVEVIVQTEGDIEGMIKPRIGVMLLDVDLAEGMLSISSGNAAKP